MKPSDVLCQVFSMVDGICRRDFPSVRFYCGPACPSDRCPGQPDDYIEHSRAQRLVPRRHVFNILPARKEDVMISLYCVNHNFQDMLMEWLP